MPARRKACSNCGGIAVRLCPFCKIDVRDDSGKVVTSKPGSGCRACLGKGVFVCPVCDGNGFELVDEIEVPQREVPKVEDTAK